MNKLAAEMTARIQRALKSGKLQQDKSYSVAELAVVLSTTRTVLTATVNLEFGSIANFYEQAKIAVAK